MGNRKRKRSTKKKKEKRPTKIKNDKGSSDDDFNLDDLEPTCFHCDLESDHWTVFCPNKGKTPQEYTRLYQPRGTLPPCGYCGQTHPRLICPYKFSVPPDVPLKPGVEIYCRVCHEKVCYIRSRYLKKNPHYQNDQKEILGYADYKSCDTCSSIADHWTTVCPLSVEGFRRCLADPAFATAAANPEKTFRSFYVFNLPPKVTEVELYGHFLELGAADCIVTVAVHSHESNRYGYLLYNDSSTAAEAFNNGKGSQIHGREIKFYVFPRLESAGNKSNSRFCNDQEEVQNIVNQPHTAE